MDTVHLNQKKLARRGTVIEATLERWRSEGIGSIFPKLQCQLRYRLADIETYEEPFLASSTKSVLIS